MSFLLAFLAIFRLEKHTSFLEAICHVAVIRTHGGYPPLLGDKYAAINGLRRVLVCKIVITKGLPLNSSKQMS
jgi:hypothetical protein